MTARRAVLIVGLAWAPALLAQGSTSALQINLPGNPNRLSITDRPSVVTHGVLAGRKIRDLLVNTFPARLSFHLELYKKNRWFDDLKGGTDWDVIVALDPATHRYTVGRQHNQQHETLGSFATIDEAAKAVESAYVVPSFGQLERGSEYYYAARLEVRSLQMSELDAVQRWLRGELQPAVQGKRNPITAFREGLETTITRVIGGDRRTYEARSPVFTVG